MVNSLLNGRGFSFFECIFRMGQPDLGCKLTLDELVTGVKNGLNLSCILGLYVTVRRLSVVGKYESWLGLNSDHFMEVKARVTEFNASMRPTCVTVRDPSFYIELVTELLSAHFLRLAACLVCMLTRSAVHYVFSSGFMSFMNHGPHFIVTALCFITFIFQE
jgi:hypothetical protein